MQARDTGLGITRQILKARIIGLEAEISSLKQTLSKVDRELSGESNRETYSKNNTSPREFVNQGINPYEMHTSELPKHPQEGQIVRKKRYPMPVAEEQPTMKRASNVEAQMSRPLTAKPFSWSRKAAIVAPPQYQHPLNTERRTILFEEFAVEENPDFEEDLFEEEQG